MPVPLEVPDDEIRVALQIISGGIPISYRRYDEVETDDRKVVAAYFTMAVSYYQDAALSVEALVDEL